MALSSFGISEPRKIRKSGMQIIDSEVSRLLSDGVERLLLHRLDEAIENLIDLGPARQFLYIVEPALDVRIGREVAADDLAERDQRSTEIVGDSDLVAAQILLFRADPMVVEDLQPALGILAAELEGRCLRLFAAPLQMRKQLRIAKIIGPFPVEIGIEPVHDLVDLGALFQILRIGGAGA